MLFWLVPTQKKRVLAVVTRARNVLDRNNKHRLYAAVRRALHDGKQVTWHPYGGQDGGIILICTRWLSRVYGITAYPMAHTFSHDLWRVLDLQPFPVCVLNAQGIVIATNACLRYLLHDKGTAVVHGQSFAALFPHGAPSPCGQDNTSYDLGQNRIRHPREASSAASAPNNLYAMRHASGYPVYVSMTAWIPWMAGTIVCMNHHVLPVSTPAGHLEALPLPAALLDENGGILRHNQRLHLHARHWQQGLLNQWLDPSARGEFVQQLHALRRQSMTEDIPGYAHVRLRPLHSPEFLVFLQYIPDHTGRMPGQFLALFVMFDLLDHTKDTDSHKMQLLGQLASGIVHDFNNLLTGILGFCDLLLQRHTSDEPSFSDVQQIKHSAQGAARLIQQLLAFSKSAPVRHQLVCLPTCVQDVLPMMHRLVGPKIMLRLESSTSVSTSSSSAVLSPNVCPLSLGLYTQADPSQIEQILLNLAINARDAMADGGVLTFCLRTVQLKQPHPVMHGTLPAGPYVLMDIRDTGTGIPSAYVTKIFDPFFSTKSPGQGTGLGLANVLQTMQSFSGGVTVQTQEGQGTVFTLYFPACAPQGAVQSADCGNARADRVAGTGDAGGRGDMGRIMPSPDMTLDSEGAKQKAAAQLSGFTDPQHAPTRILLVEDEDPVRLFASRALRAKGHVVIEARDGMYALDCVQKEAPFDVVVTDVMMPGIDGPALAIKIRAQWPTTKILFVSGYPEEQVRAYLPGEVQTVYFLPKPFTLDDLINKIHTISHNGDDYDEGGTKAVAAV